MKEAVICICLAGISIGVALAFVNGTVLHHYNIGQYWMLNAIFFLLWLMYLNKENKK